MWLLFYYFPTKTDLLRALVAERLDLDPIDTTDLVAVGDPARALLNVFRRLHELQDASDVRRIIVWREQRTNPEVRARLRDYRRQLQGVVERVLGASLLHPIAARRVRAAASAWVAIITTLAPSDRAMSDLAPADRDGETDEPVEMTDLPELAELISAGLREPSD
jgi:AcrR family transcriptional regulator